MSFHRCGDADSKPEERSALGRAKIARITTKTSILLTLYFCNVVVVSRATNSQNLSTDRKDVKENGKLRRACYRQEPK